MKSISLDGKQNFPSVVTRDKVQGAEHKLGFWSLKAICLTTTWCIVPRDVSVLLEDVREFGVGSYREADSLCAVACEYPKGLGFRMSQYGRITTETRDCYQQEILTID